jgi:hypothetical protein
VRLSEGPTLAETSGRVPGGSGRTLPGIGKRRTLWPRWAAPSGVQQGTVQTGRNITGATPSRLRGGSWSSENLRNTQASMRTPMQT